MIWVFIAVVAASGAQAVRPNILIVNIDDLRRLDDPNIQAPHLQSLRSQSLFFANAYAQAPHCCPSRNSYMTSRRPDTTKVYNGGGRYNFREVGPDWVTMPQYFRNNGYVAVGTGKVFHEYGGRGPGYWGPNRTDDESWSPSALPYPDPQPTGCPNEYNGTQHPSGCAVPATTDEEIAATAISLIERYAGGSKPFFIACGFHKPHLPWAVPQRYYDLYSAQTVRLAKTKTAPKDYVPIGWRRPFGPLATEENKDEDLGGWNSTPTSPVSDSEAAHLRRGYYAAVSYVDGLVGRVLASLKACQVFNSTIVAVWGDHGWQLGEQGEWSKMTLYDLSLRTGLLLRDPAAVQSHGRRDNSVVELLDVYPTLQALASFPVSAQLQGRSLAGHLTNHATGTAVAAEVRDGWALSSYPRCPSDPTTPWLNNECWTAERKDFTAMGYTLRNSSWRLTWWLRWNGTTESPVWNGEDFGCELFDHGGDDATDLDKYGNVNVASDHPDVAMELKAVIRSMA